MTLSRQAIATALCLAALGAAAPAAASAATSAGTAIQTVTEPAPAPAAEPAPPAVTTLPDGSVAENALPDGIAGENGAVIRGGAEEPDVPLFLYEWEDPFVSLLAGDLLALAAWLRPFDGHPEIQLIR